MDDSQWQQFQRAVEMAQALGESADLWAAVGEMCETVAKRFSDLPIVEREKIVGDATIETIIRWRKAKPNDRTVGLTAYMCKQEVMYMGSRTLKKFRQRRIASRLMFVFWRGAKLVDMPFPPTEGTYG